MIGPLILILLAALALSCFGWWLGVALFRHVTGKLHDGGACTTDFNADMTLHKGAPNA